MPAGDSREISIACCILDRIEKLAGTWAEHARRSAPLSRCDSLAVSLGRRVDILIQATDMAVTVTIAAPSQIAANVAARRQELAARLERRGWRVGRIRIHVLPEKGSDPT